MQKRKEKLFLFLLLFTLPMLSFAQKQLTGIVKDASNGEKNRRRYHSQEQGSANEDQREWRVSALRYCGRQPNL